jgi:hypothetical protein
MSEFEDEKLFSARPRTNKSAPDGNRELTNGDASLIPGRPLATAQVAALQRSAGNAAVVQLLAGEDPMSRVKELVGRGGGQPLPEGLRTDMEERFGQDFSSVRTHTGPEADSSARSLQAKAYTVGDEIVLGDRVSSVDSEEGQRTLAHELTHVVQQRSGPVDGTEVGGTAMRISDPSDQFETEAASVAAEIVSAPSSGPTSSVGSGGASGQSVPVQRDDDFEDDLDEDTETEITDTDTDTGEEPADIGDTDYDTGSDTDTATDTGDADFNTGSDTDTDTGDADFNTGSDTDTDTDTSAAVSDQEVQDQEQESASEEQDETEEEEEETGDEAAGLDEDEEQDETEDEDQG